MLELLYRVYTAFFARKVFYKFNKLLYSLSLRGLGVLNFDSAKISGEEYFIKNFASKADDGVILDVGANIGNYSKRLRATNQNFVIYAFEPHPKTFLKLKENTNNLDINVLNNGVGAKESILTLYDYANNDGSEHASLYKDVIEVIHNKNAVEHDVRIITLDEFVEECKIEKVKLLKIDTEGHELEVLKGFSKFISDNKVEIIHFEFNEMNIASRVFFKDFWDILPNYDFFRMLPDGLVPIKSYNPVFCEIFAYQNIVAILKKNAGYTGNSL